MDFKERLFELRRQAGLSQEELAHLLGLTRQAVQKWEAGTSRPDMDNLAALADYFHVSLDYLRGREGACPPPPPEQEYVPPAPTIIHHHYHEGWHYEYKSERTLFGLPLVHVNFGRGNHWARGIVAIGNIATGFVALGLLAWGGIALGWLAVGGCAVGVYAAGGVAAASRVAVGYVASAPLAIGQLADGVTAIRVPLEGLSDAAVMEAHAAITEACQDAPFFVTRFLKFFAWAELH